MQVKIEKMDNNLKGICYVNDKITFVPNVLPKEEVEIELVEEHSKYNVAKLVRVVKPSIKRKESFCFHNKSCGSCTLSILSYDDGLFYKQERLEYIINSITLINRCIAIIECVNNKEYRNKITLHVKDGVYGYYIENTNTVVPIDECPIAKKEINEFLEYLDDFNIKNGDVIIRANSKGELLINFLTKDNITIPKISNLLIVGILVNNEVVFGNNYLIEKVDDLYFKVTYDAFFQINIEMLKNLFSLLKEDIIPNGVCLDLFCGTGTLGLSIARLVSKVYGIEINKNAYLDACYNAKMNGIDNAYYLCGDANEMIKDIKDTIDFVIVDPPRSGLNNMGISLLKKMKVKRIIYISCNPITLARDINSLDIYKVSNIIGLDMFCYTYHVETFCVLDLKSINK